MVREDFPEEVSEGAQTERRGKVPGRGGGRSLGRGQRRLLGADAYTEEREAFGGGQAQIRERLGQMEVGVPGARGRVCAARESLLRETSQEGCL